MSDSHDADEDKIVPFQDDAKKPKSRRGKATKEGRGEKAGFESGGAKGPAEFNVAEVADETRLWWENAGGDSFWIENAGGWSKWSQNAIESYLTSKFVRKPKREGEFLSDQQRLLLYVREHRMIEEALPALSGYRAGIYHLTSGERVMVRHSPKLVEPEAGEWETVRALIHSKLDFSWGSDVGGATDQTPYFHGWMKTALEGLYLGGPGNFRPGQACIFAGPKDSGKSRLQHQIITGLLGGRSADPGPYLFGRTDFNGECFSSEHLMMEDPASSWKAEQRVYFGEMVKGFVVNDTQRLHRKREDAMIVSPFFRLTISINDDPDKLRILPLLTPDMKDKLHLFLISPADLPMPTETLDQRRLFREKIASELPAYAWWLLNEFEIPEGLRSVRFGVKEWHHPTLSLELLEDTPSAELMTVVDAANFASGKAQPIRLWDLVSHASEKEDKWEGSAFDLERLLLGEFPDTPSTVVREAKRLFLHNKIERLLSRLKEDAPDRVAQRRTNSARRWVITAPE